MNLKINFIMLNYFLKLLAKLLFIISTVGTVHALDLFNENENKVELTLIEIRTITSALDLFRLENFTYPSSEDGLEVLNGEYSEKMLIDPWGNKYKYTNPGIHSEVDIYSHGPDGIESKDDIGNWMIDD